MSIKYDMLLLAGLHNKAKETQLNEMGLREMDKNFQALIDKAHMEMKNNEIEKVRETLKNAATVYVNKISFYTKKDFDSAALTARRGWTKSSNNKKVLEIFKNNQRLIKMFEQVLMGKIGNIKIEREARQIRKRQEKGIGEKIIIDPKTGEKKKIEMKTSSSAAKQRKIKTDLMKTVEKIDLQRQQMLKDVESNDIEKIKKIAAEVIELEPTKTDEKILKRFLNGEVEVGLAKKILIDSLKIGGDALEALVRISLEAKGIKDLTDEDVERIQKRMGLIEKRKTEKEKSELKKMQAKAQEKNEEIMNIKGKIIAESLGYEGSYFWENYVFSKLLKRFVEDASEIGIEETKEIYTDLFGYETFPIWKYMANNEEQLYEAYEIKEQLLFEQLSGVTSVIDTIKQQKTMKDVAGLTTGFGSLYNKKTNSKLIGFLKGLWNKIKEFGAPIIKKIKTWTAPAVNWIKGILGKGIKFVTTNPIAKIAVPMVVIVGSITGAIALINKIRKKAKMKKMNKNEIDNMREILVQKENELEDLKKKGIPNIDKIQKEIETIPKVRVSIG